MTKKGKIIKLIILIVLLSCLIGIYFFVEKKNEEIKEEKEKSNESSIIINSTDIEKILSFSYIYDGEKYSFQKENDTWVCLNDAQIELDQDKIANLISNLKEVKANRIVEEESTKLEEYGLNNPTNVIEVKDLDGNEYSYYIGNKNQTVDGYYIKLDTSNTVYLISTTFPSSFNKNLDDLKKVEEENSTQETTQE